jgi:hypothetical protein
MTTEHPHIKEPVNGEYPFEVLLLSGKPLQTSKLGRFVIDLDTLSWHKDSLIVDYNHDEEKILGFVDDFSRTDEGLVVRGKLISDSFVDRLVELSARGTPFEASPTITQQEGEAVFVPKDESAVVNGETHQGPLTIFKHVPLRGMGICPHGTDRFTHFTVLKERFETMPKTKTSPDLTKLSDEGAGPSVKDSDLAEFVSIYGTEKGVQLWQSGADIADIRTMKELIEKYGVPEPPADPAPEPPVEPEPDPKKADDKTGLKAELSALQKTVTGLTAEVTRLRAAFPRGEKEPVSHGVKEETPPEPTKPRPGIYGMADKFATQNVK